MRSRAAAPFLVGAVAALACSAIVEESRVPLVEARERIHSQSRPLYLPSSEALAYVSMGHRSSLADVYYLWSIQYFAAPPVPGDVRPPWIARVYDVITDLDPHFRDAYWLGFLSLLQDARDDAAAFALVDKGLTNEPGHVMLAIDASFAAKALGDKERMLRYLGIASRSSGDPLARRLLTTLDDSGTTQDELVRWRSLQGVDDGLTRAIAKDHVRDLEQLIDATLLQELARCYARQRGIAAGSLDQLVRAGYLGEVWLDPDGQPYVYDARALTVSPRAPYRYKPPSRARSGISFAGLGACATGAVGRPAAPPAGP